MASHTIGSYVCFFSVVVSSRLGGIYTHYMAGCGLTGPLHKHSLGHWNNTVEGLAQNVLKMYMEFDIHLYDRSVSPC